MLGHAITTELQLLAARDREADLAASFGTLRATDSAREGDDRTASAAVRQQDEECSKRARRPAAA